MSARTSAKTAALAILAVARHAVDHDLTADSIDAPITPGDPLTVKVRSVHLDAWLATVQHNDDPLIQTIGDAKAYESIKQQVLVPSPIGDIRVQLLCVRRRATNLHAVPTAGAAS